jgi:hypothetical protein
VLSRIEATCWCEQLCNVQSSTCGGIKISPSAALVATNGNKGALGDVTDPLAPEVVLRGQPWRARSLDMIHIISRPSPIQPLFMRCV